MWLPVLLLWTLVCDVLVTASVGKVAGTGVETKGRLNSSQLVRDTEEVLREAHLRSSRHKVELDGDLVLGGLMMVHEREDPCGQIMPQGGIQALEAMLFTLDYINTHRPLLLPNIELGALIMDDCDKDSFGLTQAVDFIKGVDSHDLGNLSISQLCLMLKIILTNINTQQYLFDSLRVRTISAGTRTVPWLINIADVLRARGARMKE